MLVLRLYLGTGDTHKLMKIVVKNAIKKKKGYNYWIDKDGNIVQEKHIPHKT